VGGVAAGAGATPKPAKKSASGVVVVARGGAAAVAAGGLAPKKAAAPPPAGEPRAETEADELGRVSAEGEGRMGLWEGGWRERGSVMKEG